jgi:hypothetical protein
MRSFTLSSLIPFALGIFASAAPTPGGGSGGGGLIDIDALVAADIDTLRRGSGGGGGLIDVDALVAADVEILRRGYSDGGNSDSGLIDIDVLVDADINILRRGSGGGLIDVDALVAADIEILRRDDETTLESILCGVVSSVDALIEKISQSFPPSFLSSSLPSLFSQPRRRRVYCGNFGPNPHRG